MGKQILGKNVNVNDVMTWEWVGMGMGMMLWEWEGAGTLKLIPVHLYLKVVFRNHTLALLPYVTLPSLYVGHALLTRTT